MEDSERQRELEWLTRRIDAVVARDDTRNAESLRGPLWRLMGYLEQTLYSSFDLTLCAYVHRILEEIELEDLYYGNSGTAP